jgi:hypothetical protein
MSVLSRSRSQRAAAAFLVEKFTRRTPLQKTRELRIHGRMLFAPEGQWRALGECDEGGRSGVPACGLSRRHELGNHFTAIGQQKAFAK